MDSLDLVQQDRIYKGACDKYSTKIVGCHVFSEKRKQTTIPGEGNDRQSGVPCGWEGSSKGACFERGTIPFLELV